jgi:protein-tyrosine phosphatase
VHLLFVCTGNICRSPMGERLTRAYAQEAQLSGVSLTASSAGIQAVVGRAMEPSSALVLEGLGGDPTGFTARQLTAAAVDEADLVLVMAEIHRDAVLRESPRAMNRTFLLREARALVPTVAAAHRGASGGAVVAQLGLARARRVRPPRGGDDVTDPIGRSIDVHQQVGEQIAGALIPVLDALVGHSAPAVDGVRMAPV